MTTTRLETLLNNVCRSVRADIIRSTTAANSGHPTSSLSAVELMVGLMFGGTFRADLDRPKNPNNDRLVFSKGHAAPLLYSLYRAAGKITAAEILTLRREGSRLEGHPMPTFPYTEVPTGSLGQGLSAGVGIALAARLQRLSYRTFVLLGDSELAEGSNWEAIQLAAHQRLGNLVAVLDVNRLGQSGPTMVGHRLEVYAQRFRAFGWRALTIDGHNIGQILKAYKTVRNVGHRPTVIIAKTIKGKSLRRIENREGWHGWALAQDEAERALRDLGPWPRRLTIRLPRPRVGQPHLTARQPAERTRYPAGRSVSTRSAFGNALTRLGRSYPALVVLDAEVKNSTYTERFEKYFPKRFIETYIAEQNMVGIANGLASRGMTPVAVTFAAFLTRAFDQLRMAQYASTHQIYIGTHAGVSIGKDGPSQMGLEDIAMFRTLTNSTVLYPADAYAAERLLDQALRSKGIVYLRGTRAELPLVYSAGASFAIGGSATLRSSRKDALTIAAAGVTLHQALAAADRLAEERIPVRVIDLYSLKPIDAPALRRAIRQTGQLIVVEDHHPEGGIAEAVRSALGPDAGKVTSLAVRVTPHSADMSEQLAHANISTQAIIRTVKRLRS